ncbi:MAG TPA: DUF58 domain-containing protein [Thermoplasmata archaeon]|nr:DUF58 domain-containing protein [Thermoplasmata archaeon]
MTQDPEGPPPALHWRPRAIVLYAAGAIFGLLALLLRTPVPLFLAVPLLLAPVAAGLYLPNRPVRVRVEWEEEGEGPRVTIRGRLSAGPGVLSTSLFARFVRPEPLLEEKPSSFRFTEAGQEFRHFWKAPFPCIADVPVPQVTWRDPLGLAESPLPVDGTPLPVERFPPELNRISRVQMERTTPLPGEVRSRALGRSGEFFSIRPVHPGDTPRQINWRASARAGTLLANDFLQERTGDVLLLLDLRPTSLGTGRDDKLLSVMRAAAIGIARAFLDQKTRVGLGLFGEFLTAVPLGSGRRQRFRLLQALRRCRMGSEASPAERLAVSLRQYFPPGVLTLLISPLADEESLALLPHLRRRGYPVVVLSPSPVALLTPEAGTETPDDLSALRLMRLVRRQQVGQVWREAPAVDWEDFWSLGPLVHLLRRPAYSRRGL